MGSIKVFRLAGYYQAGRALGASAREARVSARNLDLLTASAGKADIPLCRLTDLEKSGVWIGGLVLFYFR